MRFSLAAVVAMAASVLAQDPNFNPIYKPERNERLAAGQEYTITWETGSYPDEIINIYLIGGASTDVLTRVSTIATGVPNSDKQYRWTVAADLGGLAVYGLNMTVQANENIFQYSNPFFIVGDGSRTSTTTTGTSPVTLSSTTPVASSTLAVTSTATTSAVSTPIIVTSTATTSAISTPIIVTSSPASTSSVFRNTTMTARPTIPSNSTTLATRPATTSTATSVGTVGPTSTRVPTSVPTAAASVVGTGSFGILAALAAAFFAL